MNNPININTGIANICLRELAKFGSAIYGNDIYYLKNFIDILIPVVGEEEIIKRMKEDESRNKKRIREIGNNWETTKNKMKKLDKIIEKTKATYDLLEDKTLKKKKTPSYKNLIIRTNKISTIKNDLYTIMIFLLENTTIGRMTIPTEYFKILEHKGHRPISEVEKRRIGGIR